MTDTATATNTTATTTATTEAPAAVATTELASPFTDAGATTTTEAGTEAAAGTVEAPAGPTANERARAIADKLKAGNRARQKAERDRIDADNRAANLEAQLHSERNARQAADAQLQRIQDPKTFLDEATRRGITSKAITQAQIDETTPEGMARRALEEAQSVRQENKRLQESIEQRDTQSARQTFITEAKAYDDPYIRGRARANPTSLIAEAEQLWNEHGPSFRARHGRLPSFNELIKHISVSYAEAQEAPARVSDNATTASAATDKAQPNGQQVVPNSSGTGARTLTNRAAEKGTLPPNIDSLPREEMISAIGAQVRALKARSAR